jgi:hypothetical protein
VYCYVDCFAVVFYAHYVPQLLLRSSRPVMGVATALWLVAARVLADEGYSALGWTEQTGTTTNDIGYGVAVSGDGSIFVTGSTYGALNGQVSAGEYHNN